MIAARIRAIDTELRAIDAALKMLHARKRKLLRENHRLLPIRAHEIIAEGVPIDWAPWSAA
jgi:hypothetical protein